MAKKRQEPDFDTVAYRLCALRDGIGLTRKEVEKSCGLSSQSLKGWELGARGLKEKNAKILSDMYKAHGLNCTPEWILYGTGLNPLEKLTVTPENDYIVKDITRFKVFYPDAVVLEALMITWLPGYVKVIW